MNATSHVSHGRVRDYVLGSLRQHERDLVPTLQREFAISRQAANWHVRKMVAGGLIGGEGQTRARRYQFRTERLVDQSLAIAEHREEDEVWRTLIAPALEGLPDNVRAICRYGFNEMFNNVVSHSDSRDVVVHVDRGPGLVSVDVIDFGVGVFRRIQDAFGFPEPRDVVLELAKGKLTTDPRRHTGEGIFFTSRMFDQFTILSGSLFWACTPDQRDWLVEDRDEHIGTVIGMRISPASKRTEQQVFNRYSNNEDYRFSRTEVPILLAAFGEDPLVSRSGARRVLGRLDRFDHVFLDFKGVKSIGQQFADEIFRVFVLEHPDVIIEPVRANRAVSRMISRAKAALEEQRQQPGPGPR